MSSLCPRCKQRPKTKWGVCFPCKDEVDEKDETWLAALEIFGRKRFSRCRSLKEYWSRLDEFERELESDDE